MLVIIIEKRLVIRTDSDLQQRLLTRTAIGI